MSTLPAEYCMKFGDVNEVFGAPQFLVLKRLAMSIRNSGRKRPIGNALKIEKSTFHCAGRRKKLRFVFPKPATSSPLGCEKSDLS